MKFIGMLFLLIFFLGCSNRTLVYTKNNLPLVEESKEKSVSLFMLNNYTDTPRAGMRSANIIEGILLTKGYKVQNHITTEIMYVQTAQKIAQKESTDYFLIGGVSEWRYKTGIDGEPAVSLQCSMYETNTSKLIWSATGADSDWGVGSIGTTAQDLLETMMYN